MYTTTASTGMANNCSGPVSGNTATDDEEDEEDSLGRVVVSVLEEPAVTSLSLLLLASSFVELGNVSVSVVFCASLLDAPGNSDGTSWLATGLIRACSDRWRKAYSPTPSAAVTMTAIIIKDTIDPP